MPDKLFAALLQNCIVLSLLFPFSAINIWKKCVKGANCTLTSKQKRVQFKGL